MPLYCLSSPVEVMPVLFVSVRGKPANQTVRFYDSGALEQILTNPCARIYENGSSCESERISVQRFTKIGPLVILTNETGQIYESGRGQATRVRHFCFHNKMRLSSAIGLRESAKMTRCMILHARQTEQASYGDEYLNSLGSREDTAVHAIFKTLINCSSIHRVKQKQRIASNH